MLYSVYDVKGENWFPPFVASTDGAASRMIAEAARDLNTMLARYPGDHILYRIGEWDAVTGVLAPVTPPVHVAHVVQLVQVPSVAEAIAGDEAKFYGANGNGQTISDDASVLAGTAGDDTSQQVQSSERTEDDV